LLDFETISEKYIIIKTYGRQHNGKDFFLIAILFSYFVEFFQCLHQHRDVSLEKHTVGIQQIPKRIFTSKETSGEKQTSGTTEKEGLC